MSKRFWKIWTVIAAASLIVSACVPKVTPTPEPTPTPTPPPTPVVPGDEPYQINGTFTVSNNFVLANYMVENAVALVDMHGFVVRDPEWVIPVASQVLGEMTINADFASGAFDLNLPLRPEGEFSDLDNNGKTNTGVQVFAVAYWPNLYGGPFAEGDDRSMGWPSYLASVKTDAENNNEVTGGKLVVWAPDEGQSFPSGFGTDGLLFTADDPSAPLPVGYTIIDLDQGPFAFVRESAPEMILYEPTDVALKDFSSLSYSEAFDQMFELVRKEYAFNGVKDKQPNWDTLYKELKPLVQKAESDKDARAFYLALRSFTLAFKDGHVGLNGGQFASDYFNEQAGAGYGFALRELSDGRFIVIYVTPGGPAEAAGMLVGAEVTEWDGAPVTDALNKIVPFSAPMSTDYAYRYQQVRYLLRGKAGDSAEVTFTNPGGEAQTIKLTSVAENLSFGVTSIYAGFDRNAPPVEYRILPSGVGYVRINSNADDLNLTIRLFERALKTFQANNLPGLLIDLRQNAGGSPLGLAGFLTDQEIVMGQLEYYSDETKKFEPDGLPQKVLPNTNQYSFDKMVLLVGQACASACELEAYGFSQAPGMIVVGETPTSGTEAEVARGQFLLPEGMSLQIPTGRFTLPDGSIFLEGKGVQPTITVPVTEAYLRSTGDALLQAAEKIVLEPLGSGIKPSGPPTIMAVDKALKALEDGASFLEQKASEEERAAQASAPGSLSYTLSADQAEPLIWSYGWCATTQAILQENVALITLKFELDGKEIAPDQFQTYEYTQDTQFCRLLYVTLTDWPGGEHHLTTTATFTAEVDDGTTKFPPGDYIFDYTVFVKP